MSKKKSKVKLPKCKCQKPLAGVGGWSIFNGILSLIATFVIFTIFIFLDDPMVNQVQNMNEAVLALFFLFILAFIIIWFFIKIVIAGLSTAGLWVGGILQIVAGSLCLSAGRHKGNIYSNSSCKKKIITALVLWMIAIVFEALASWFMWNIQGGLSKLFTYITVGCIGFSALINLICFIVVLVHYKKNIKLVKRDENGKVIDETLFKFEEVYSNAVKHEPAVLNQVNGETVVEEKPKIKVGDITEFGRVIGFNIETGKPIYMPIDNDNI